MSNAIHSNTNIIAGKYKLDRVLGEGGMGVVLKATHLHLGECVAVKFLQPDMLNEEGLKERFIREARLLSKIKSEHVVRVYDVDTLPSGVPFFVMEHLEGSDLSERVMRGKPLSIEEAVDFAMQACVGLAEVHARGIVHRDLKPSNLFVCERSDGRPIVKLIDFGISKDIAPTSPEFSATKTTDLRGSPFFMAPEQLRHPRCADTSVDIWALGITLYHLLSASFPFEADNVMELSIKIFSERPVPLCERRKDVPQALGDVVSRCLQKNPSERFANVAELCAALKSFALESDQAYAEQAARILLHGAKKLSRPSLPTDDIAPALPPSESKTHNPPLSTTSAVARLKDRHSLIDLKNIRPSNVPRVFKVIGLATTAAIIAGTLTLLTAERHQELPVHSEWAEAAPAEIPPAVQPIPSVLVNLPSSPITPATGSGGPVPIPPSTTPPAPAQTKHLLPASKAKTNSVPKTRNSTSPAKAKEARETDSSVYTKRLEF